MNLLIGLSEESLASKKSKSQDSLMKEFHILLKLKYVIRLSLLNPLLQRALQGVIQDTIKIRV